MDELVFRVTDLKEYTYCPRVFYYEHCLPDLHRESVKTVAGRDAHDEERQRAKRRTLAAYNLSDGQREFDVPVQSEALGMIGVVDEVVWTRDRAIPVDYKNTDRIGYQFKLQLAAYGLMLEETSGLPVKRGFFYLIPKRRAEEIRFTPRLREAVQAILSDMHRIAQTEAVPDPTPYPSRCPACKYRRFCNDV